MKQILLVLLLLQVISCNTTKVEKKITITNFSKPFLDSLLPNKNLKNQYITYNAEIKGYTNDTIIVYFSDKKDSFYSKKLVPTYLIGKINKRYWEEDAGKTIKYLRIEPYKATKGTLKLKYGLYK